MMKKTIALVVMLSAGLSTSFAAPNAMDAVKSYTDTLQQALVLHDQQNIDIYTTALTTLVLYGKVNFDDETSYESQPLPEAKHIKKWNYEFRTTKANDDDNAAIYKAIETLALTYYFEGTDQSKQKTSVGETLYLNFEDNTNATTNRNKKASKNKEHLEAAQKYYAESLSSIRRGAREATSLSGLIQASYGNEPKVPYAVSVYAGIVNVDAPDSLIKFRRKDHGWITEFRVTGANPQHQKQLQILGLNPTVVKSFMDVPDKLEAKAANGGANNGSVPGAPPAPKAPAAPAIPNAPANPSNLAQANQAGEVRMNPGDLLAGLQGRGALKKVETAAQAVTAEEAKAGDEIKAAIAASQVRRKDGFTDPLVLKAASTVSPPGAPDSSPPLPAWMDLVKKKAAATGAQNNPGKNDGKPVTEAKSEVDAAGAGKTKKFVDPQAGKVPVIPRDPRDNNVVDAVEWKEMYVDWIKEFPEDGNDFRNALLGYLANRPEEGENQNQKKKAGGTVVFKRFADAQFFKTHEAKLKAYRYGKKNSNIVKNEKFKKES